MCGILAIHAKSGRPLDASIVAAMRDTMSHRGPDGAGLTLSGNATLALAHRRLAILDLSPRGHQPMVAATGNQLVFNGEIYNHRALRQEHLPHHPFDSTSDTEVLLALLEAQGMAALPRLRGMWGFVYHDVAGEYLLISRDRFGIKPLFYYEDHDQFIVASEIKAILAAPGVRKAVNRDVLDHFMATGRLDELPETCFAGIRRFPAASYGLYSLRRGVLAIHSFFNLEESLVPVERSWADNVARFRELLIDSVRLHLQSDVPVGVSLSGGLDSSALYAAAVGPLRTDTLAFCHRFDQSGCDESPHYRAVVRHLGGRMVESVPDIPDLGRILPRLLHHLEEPCRASGVYPQWLVMERAAREVKVILSGQGGDEVLAGYDPYLGDHLADLLARGDLVGLAREFRAMGEVKGWRFLRPLVRRMGDSLRHRGQFRGSRLQRCLVDAVTRESLPALLRYEDRLSMAFSLESRVPLLDHPLVCFAFSLDSGYKIREGYSKRVLREAMAAELPASVAWRRDKLGFPVPIGEMLRVNPLLSARVPVGARGDYWLAWRHLALHAWREAFQVE